MKQEKTIYPDYNLFEIQAIAAVAENLHVDGLFDQSKELWHYLGQIVPNNYEYSYKEAIACLTTGNESDGLKIINEATKNGLPAHEYFYTLGKYFWYTKRLKKGKDYLEKANCKKKSSLNQILLWLLLYGRKKEMKSYHAHYLKIQ